MLDRMFARFLASSQSVLLLRLNAESEILEHNPAAGRWLGEVLGRKLHSVLDEQGQATWEERLRADGSDSEFRLNIHHPSGRLYTLRCALDRQGDRVLLLAELELNPDHWEQLHSLYEDTVRMAREQARHRRAEARQFEQFNASHWHLARLQEYMTMCVTCGHIQVQPGEWCELTRYLRDNDLCFSHGYCPECATLALAEIGAEDETIPTNP